MIERRTKRHVNEIPAHNEQNLHVQHGQNAIPALIRIRQIKPFFKDLKDPGDYTIASGPTTSGVNLNFSLTQPSKVKVEFWFEDSIVDDGAKEYVMRPNAQKDGLILQEIEPGSVGLPPQG